MTDEINSTNNTGAGTDEFFSREHNKAHEEAKAEMLPTLAELKNKIAELPEDAERETWLPMVKAIKEATHLPPADIKALKNALGKRVPVLEPAVLKAELKLLDQEQKKAKPKSNPNSGDKSEIIRGGLVRMFGPEFVTPVLGHWGDSVELAQIGMYPWFFGREKDEDGETRLVPFCTPFLLDGVFRYVDEDGVEAMRVRIFTGNGTVETVEFPVSDLIKYKGSEVVSAMVAKGWRAEDAGERFTVRYLKTQQRLTTDVYHRPGKRNSVFVLANGDVIAPEGRKTNVELHASALLKGPFRAGTLEDWKKAAAVIFGEFGCVDEPTGDGKPSRLWPFQLGVALGNTGPLLGYLNRECMHVHFGGGTTKGKTVSMECAGAHYATPLSTSNGDDDGGCVQNAKGTLNSYENVLRRSSCMVLALDEFGKRPPKDQAEFAFTVQGGKGNMRMSKNITQRTTITWHGLVVITGAENSIAQICEVANQRFDPGMTARLLPIDFSDTFDFEPDSPEWIAVKSLRKNYGHSGRVFIEHLIGIPPEDLEARLAGFVDELLKVNGRTLAGIKDGKATLLEWRASHLVANVWLTMELEKSAGLIPATYDPVPLVKKLWRNFLECDTAPIDPNERALEKLLSNLSGGRGQNVVAFDDRLNQRSQEALAYHSVPTDGSEFCEKKDPRYYVILSTKLGRLTGNLGNPDMVKRMLDGRGFLVRPNGVRGDKSFTHPTFPHLGRGPFIVLRAEKVDDPQDN